MSGDAAALVAGRPARRRWLVAGLAVVVAVAGAATVAARLAGGSPAAPPPVAPAAVVAVARTTLVDVETVEGELGFGPERPVQVKATGTVTWLPDAGATVRRGAALLRVDDRPVVLLYGALPMYRALGPAGTATAPGSPGVGNDVRQLETNLAALGYAGFAVDDRYTAETADAVKEWQEDLGVAETGTVAVGDVHYAAGAVRVARVVGRVGGEATGDMLTVTASDRVVVAQATPGQAAWAAPGARVDVVLPDGQAVRGRVRSVSTEAVADPEGTRTTIPVVVSIDDQRAVGRLDRAPVRVRYALETRRNVLAVPVTALVALAEGGYGVELDDRPGRYVAVRTGLFADGLVEVSGPGVTAGLRVRVPG